MCGFITTFTSPPFFCGVLRTGLQRLARCGPDDEDLWQVAAAAFDSRSLERKVVAAMETGT